MQSFQHIGRHLSQCRPSDLCYSPVQLFSVVPLQTQPAMLQHPPSMSPFLPAGMSGELPNCLPAVLSPRAASGAVSGEVLLGLAGLAGGGGLGAWDWGKEAAAPGLARPLTSLDARGLGVGLCTEKGSKSVAVKFCAAKGSSSVTVGETQTEKNLVEDVGEHRRGSFWWRLMATAARYATLT